MLIAACLSERKQAQFVAQLTHPIPPFSHKMLSFNLNFTTSLPPFFFGGGGGGGGFRAAAWFGGGGGGEGSLAAAACSVGMGVCGQCFDPVDVVPNYSTPLLSESGLYLL